MTKTQFLS